MDSEASTSSSPLPTDLSPINETPTDDKKREARKGMRHPLYRGVWRRSSGKWVSEVRDPNKRSRIWLGTFPNPEMAAAAHDAATLALHGSSAQFNFPDAAHRLPRSQSASHADILSAAQNAAREFSGEAAAAAAAEFVDEEALYNMPLLVDCMAEGMLLTPPAMKKGFSWAHYDDDDHHADFDLTLWSD